MYLGRSRSWVPLVELQNGKTSSLRNVYSSQVVFLPTGEPGADPGFILGGGALVSCSISTPLNHIVFFFGRIPVVLENRRSCQGGGSAHPLHPPPRSAPGNSRERRAHAHRRIDFYKVYQNGRSKGTKIQTFRGCSFFLSGLNQPNCVDFVLRIDNSLMFLILTFF